MALVVVSDPLSPSANSYASLVEMLDYVTTRVPDSSSLLAWGELSSDQKSMYLINATRSIDSSCDWRGYKYSRDQKLDWPRYDVWVDSFMLDVTVVPQLVKDATCEMAIWSMANNGLVSVGQNAAFDSIKVGPINIDFNESVGGSADKYFPDIVSMLLRDFGTMTNPQLPGSRQMRTVRTYRA